MKTKKLLLTSLFLLLVLFTKAQDKYEFMIIEYFKDEIFISINGKEYIKETIDFGTSGKDYRNCNPFLKKVSEYQDKGWEFINFNTTGETVVRQYAYLKKKKN